MSVDDLLSALNEQKAQRSALRRFRLVKALGAKEDPRAVETLSSLARTDRSAEVRGVAVLALGRIGDPSAVPALKGALSDPANRWWAIRSLGLVRDQSSVPWFIGYLRSADTQTREFAAHSLGDIGSRAATPALIMALDDSKARVCQAAAAALANLEDPRALEPVRVAHRSAKGLARRSIGKALARLEGQGGRNFDWPKKRIAIEQELATPFMVASMLKKAIGIRGSKRKRLAETVYLARSLFSARSSQETFAFLEKALQEFPDNPELRVLYASILLEFQPDDVAAEAAKAVELGWYDPGTLVRAGHLLISNGDLEGARSCAARASEVAQPDFVLMSGLRSLNGRIAERDGNYDLAEECLRLAMKEDPTYSTFAVDLAKFLAARDRQDEALEVIEEALQLATEKNDLEQLRARIMAPSS